MSDHDALFQAILAAPDDDAPRLIYADWLDEHGNPDRAEFIRLQIDRARRPDHDPACADLERRAARRYFAEPTDWPFDWLPPQQALRRGFIEELWVRADTYVRRHAELRSCIPLRQLHLTLPPRFEIWNWELVRPLRGLELPAEPWSEYGYRRGAELPNLRWLKLVGLEAAADFLAVVPAPGLEDLVLSGSRFEGPFAVPNRPFADLSRVRSFTWDAADGAAYAERLKAGGADMVAHYPFSGLRRLRLRGQAVGDAGLSRLAAAPGLRGLEDLDLTENEIGAIGPSGIEDTASGFRHLTALALAHNPLGVDSVQELAGWAGLRQLRWLDLSGCRMPAACGRTLARSPHLHDGLRVRLDGNEFVPAAVFPTDLLHRPAGSVS